MTTLTVYAKSEFSSDDDIMIEVSTTDTAFDISKMLGCHSLKLEMDGPTLSPDDVLSRTDLQMGDSIYMLPDQQVVSKVILTKMGLDISTGALIDAIKSDRFEIVRHFANIDDAFGHLSNTESYLVTSINCGNLDMVRLVMSRSSRHDIHGGAYHAIDKIKFDILIILCVDMDIVNMTSTDGMTLLSYAVRCSNVEVVRILCGMDGIVMHSLSSGSYPSIGTGSIMSVATRNNNFEIVKILCETSKSVDVNKDIFYDRTPFQSAIKHGNYEMVKYLCERDGTDINAVGQDGTTALMTAASYGHNKIVELLCRCDNLDIYVEDEMCCTALWMASKGGHLDIVKMLAESYDPENMMCMDPEYDISDYVDYTALMCAAKNNDSKMVEFLCSLPNIKNHHLVDTIKVAFEFTSREVVKFLCVNEMFYINSQLDGSGDTAIVRAVRDGDKDLVDFICSIRGVDIYHKTRSGETALLIANEMKRADITRSICSISLSAM